MRRRIRTGKTGLLRFVRHDARTGRWRGVPLSHDSDYGFRLSLRSAGMTGKESINV
jgi:hypothetical protein